jgi:hypothetical protein
VGPQRIKNLWKEIFYYLLRNPRGIESQEPAKPPTGTGDKDREVAGAGGNRGNR